VAKICAPMGKGRDFVGSIDTTRARKAAKIPKRGLIDHLARGSRNAG